jgi:cyclopropane fatty-acyl-phospholipid synthase-like methyltransferase
MSGTPDWQKRRVCEYYQSTNERSYLANWSGKALSYHLGLSDETTASLDEAHNNSNAYLADHLGIAKSTRVLDAGCGVGGTSIWLAVERGAKVTGITIDPEQVDLARKFAEERAVLDRVSFHTMDYAATTFAPGSFDVVFNLESVCHSMDVQSYFAHVATLLAPGGTYGCMECFVAAPGSDRVKRVMDGWAMQGWQSKAAVVDALRQVGFRDLAVTDLGREVRRSAEQLLAMARNTEVFNRLAGAAGTDPVFDGHVSGGIACCEGLISGEIEYAFVRAVRPRADKVQS